MYKDFKKSESLDTGFVGGSGIIWMFSGVILGLVVGLGMYYFANNDGPSFSTIDSVEKKIATAQARTRSQHQVSQATSQTTQTSAITRNQGSTGRSDQAFLSDRNDKMQRRTNFSYYAVLPNLDVPVGVAKPIKTSHIPGDKPGMDAHAAKKAALLEANDIEKADASVAEGGFLIQVASFKRRSSANKTVKGLRKKGVSAQIQEKKVKGRIWYRVIAGPVGSDGVDRWKLAAEKMGHRPIVTSIRR